MNKPRIILLSDLWGKEKSAWLGVYIDGLAQYFDVMYYDSCELGELADRDNSEQNRHEQFVNGGVDRAVQNILLLEQKPVYVLGFSVGGYIAWKAAVSGLNVVSLYAISSTRLRVESEKPATNIALFYGQDDAYIPNNDWFQQMDVERKIYPNETHDFYQKIEIAAELCKLIIEKTAFVSVPL